MARKAERCRCPLVKGIDTLSKGKYPLKCSSRNPVLQVSKYPVHQHTGSPPHYPGKLPTLLRVFLHGRVGLVFSVYTYLRGTQVSQSLTLVV